MEAESAEMEGTPSLEALFSEHNYFKTQAAADDVEPMETAESAATSLDSPTSAGQSLSLTQLDASKDTFETCLIQLLHAYTTNRRGGGGSNSPPSTASTPQSEGGASGGGGGVSKGAVGGASGGGGGQGTPPPAAPFIDISPESLTSLSPEQVSVLVTSNSVNYEVIQQIMAQKQGYQGIPMKAASLVPGSGNNGGQLDPDAANNNNGSSNNGQSSRQQTPDGVSPSGTAAAGEGGGGGGGVISKGGSSGSNDSTPPMGSPSGVPSQQILKNPIQISPEHLQVLQQQVSDLLRSKQISLPADMTAQQQQALIHSILLKQLKEKQLATSVSGVSSSVSQPRPPASVASTSGSSSSAPPSIGSARRATGGRVTAAIVKKDLPSSAASLTLGNLLSSSDNMSGQSIAAMKTKEEKKEKNLTSVTPATSLSTPPSLPDTTKPSSLPTSPPPPTSAAPTPTVPASSTQSSSSAAVKQPPSRTEPSASTTTTAATNPKAASSSSAPAAPAKSSSNTSPPSTRTSAGKSGGGGGGGRGKKKGDSNKNEPKKPPMPYNIFFSEVYSTVMAANPKMTFADASRIISMMWNAMGSDVKQKYHERHEELKEEYQANLKKFKEQEQQQLQREKEKEREGGEEAHQPIKTEDAPATSPENKEGNLLQCAESAVESGDLEDEAMEITQHEVKDPSLCVNHGCSNKAVFEKDRGPQYCSNECVVMDTRNVFASWIRNRKVRE